MDDERRVGDSLHRIAEAIDDVVHGLGRSGRRLVGLVPGCAFSFYGDMKNGAVGHRSLLALTPHDDLGVHRAQATGPLRGGGR